MSSQAQDEEVVAIRSLIARQFASLTWTESGSANWVAFAADFASEASLYASARPAEPQTVNGFIERMKSLASGPLRKFEESVLGTDVRVFGNVALAVAACEAVENETVVSRSVEMMLLVKDEGRWQIVSQAWDSESAKRLIPPDLLGSSR